MNKRLFLKAAAIGLAAAVTVNAILLGLSTAVYVLNLPPAFYYLTFAFLLSGVGFSFLAYDYLRQKEWEKRRDGAQFVKAELYNAKGERI